LGDCTKSIEFLFLLSLLEYDKINYHQYLRRGGFGICRVKDAKPLNERILVNMRDPLGKSAVMFNLRKV
jgi:hypothetical protein